MEILCKVTDKMFIFNGLFNVLKTNVYNIV